jgi:hypothetical protein
MRLGHGGIVCLRLYCRFRQIYDGKASAHYSNLIKINILLSESAARKGLNPSPSGLIRFAKYKRGGGEKIIIYKLNFLGVEGNQHINRIS